MNEVTREIVRKIDAEIEELSKTKKDIKLGEVVKPYIEKYAKEAGIDELDLFVDYMDHVALTSKQMSLNSEGETMFGEADLERPDFKLY